MGPIMLCIITAEKQCMSIKRHYGAFTDRNPITTSLFLTVNRHIRDSAALQCLGVSRHEKSSRSDLRSAGFVKGPLLDIRASADLRSEARLVVASDGCWIIYPGCRTLGAEIQTLVWRQLFSLVAIRCRLVATTEGDCVRRRANNGGSGWPPCLITSRWVDSNTSLSLKRVSKTRFSRSKCRTF